MAAYLGNSALIALVTVLFAVTGSLVLGILAGLYRDRWADHLISTVALIGMSIPEFVVATVLVLCFSIALPWFPAVVLYGPDASVGQLLPAVWLPALSLAIVMAAYIVRMARTSVIDVMASEYVTTARLKGLSTWRVVTRHALPSALLPTLHVIALNVAWLAGRGRGRRERLQLPGHRQADAHLGPEPRPARHPGHRADQRRGLRRVQPRRRPRRHGPQPQAPYAREDPMTPLDTTPSTAPATVRARTARAWRTLRSSRTALAGLAIVAVHVVIALLAPLLTAYDPIANNPSQALLGPGWEHWAGTDQYGRDVLARVLYGGRYALGVSARRHGPERRTRHGDRLRGGPARRLVRRRPGPGAGRGALRAAVLALLVVVTVLGTGLLGHRPRRRRRVRPAGGAGRARRRACGRARRLRDRGAGPGRVHLGDPVAGDPAEHHSTWCAWSSRCGPPGSSC